MAFVLPHWDDCFVQAFPAETTEALLEAHAKASTSLQSLWRTARDS